MASWIEPVTDRTDGSARMTYIDMNRITGNINLIRELARSEGRTIPGSDISKTSWIKNDIITIQEWTELLNALNTVAQAVGYSPGTNPDYSMYFQNINIIESITLAVYTILINDSDDARLNHYVGDQLPQAYTQTPHYLYAGEPFNAGGDYN